MKNLLLKTLTYFSTKILKVKKPKIVAITGSAGKTTTKEAIYTVLKSSRQWKREVFSNYGNLNTEFGIPLSIALIKTKPPSKITWIFVFNYFIFKSILILIGLVKYPKILILEMAADKPGDLKYLTNYIKPNIAIITNIGPAHLENFIEIEKVISEKAEIIKNLSSGGIAILNIQSSYYKKLEKYVPFDAKLISIDFPVEESYIGFSRLVGKYFRLNLSQIDSVLNHYSPPKGRFEVIEKNGLVIIDSSYNSNPLSLRVVLTKGRSLKMSKRPTRYIGIIGDMKELGLKTDEYHKQFKTVLKKDFDIIIGVGEKSILFEPDHHFNRVDEAIPFVLRLVKKNDMILIKGSHSVHLEKIVNKLIK